MNASLVISGVVAALDLAIRLAQSRGHDPETLETYIETRNLLRQELVNQANMTGDTPDAPEADGGQDVGSATIVGGQGTEDV